MRLVILETPYRGITVSETELNILFARACLRDSLMRGESPIASHLLYTQPGVLDDNKPGERQLGIEAGLAWRAVADGSVVYTNRGVSEGMKYGIGLAKHIERRSLAGWND
jgi:hypothetical protein